MDASVAVFLTLVSALILTYLVTRMLQSWFGRYDQNGQVKSQWSDRFFYTVWVLLLVGVMYGVPQLLTNPRAHSFVSNARSLWN